MGIREILKKSRVISVEVPELGTLVQVRVLSLRELRELVKVSDDSFAPALLAASVLDEEGLPLFASAEEADAVANLDGQALLKAVRGVNLRDVEKAAKN